MLVVEVRGDAGAFDVALDSSAPSRTTSFPPATRAGCGVGFITSPIPSATHTLVATFRGAGARSLQADPALRVLSIMCEVE